MLLPTIWSCKKLASLSDYSVDVIGEFGQQVGDAMASLDKSGGSTSGDIANFDVKSYKRTFLRLSGGDISNLHAALLRIFPVAEATACSAVTFSQCFTNQSIRYLDGCAVSGGGTIALNFTGSGAPSCTIPMNNAG